ncbi:uncharacterized protein LOC122020180 [Zingiber officinale]|uniref:BUB1 N-terminal domain-containing protein n=1 Tax=Zingiber officinale TaxID=94328 RepID=A0A8J5EYW2_ZINOF|nr:uncharacterized protein LOC122020180 [Zingiber officinale]KAG6477817.1 hypothetical protein ZIOFF_061249 [Zingiber officinale]
MADDFQRQLLSSIVSDIKSYEGGDPLRPWIHGIRRMRETFPPRILKEKLPRFLQKCAQEFETDRRYRNDSRYLRIWIELMDYVHDAKVLLRKMEKNEIGLKRAVFYLAYALYYEKHKKFDEAEKVYRLGVQNLAEPINELQKTYGEFVQRMELYKKRKAKEVISKKGCLSLKGNKENIKIVDDKVAERNSQIPNHSKGLSDKGNITGSNIIIGHSKSIQDSSTNLESKHGIQQSAVVKTSSKKCDDAHSENHIPNNTDDTVVVKFVDSAIVGRSEAENACHHGLVDPTINMKEAMSEINNMFQEPLDIMVKRRSSKSKSVCQKNEFKVFIDEDTSDVPKHPSQFPNSDQCGVELSKFKSDKHVEFKILADDEDDDVIHRHSKEFKPPNNINVPKKQIDSTAYSISTRTISGFNEETVHRFVGSTVLDESKVENACHHGLLDPTINLKEAMDDINSMFGQPLDFKGSKPKKKAIVTLATEPKSDEFYIFVDEGLWEPSDSKCNKPKKKGVVSRDKEPASDGFFILADDSIGETFNIESSKQKEKGFLSLDNKPTSDGFFILADDELDDPKGNASTSIPHDLGENGGLFEPTIFTKEAMAEINDLFGKPLDF